MGPVLLADQRQLEFPSLLPLPTTASLAEDVTPAPFNQPPYPTSGDIEAASCTVAGIAP